jgi:hypothetical protein
MRRYLPESGVVFLKLRDPEDKKLFSRCSTVLQEEVGEDIPVNAFLVRLMKHYLATRDLTPAKVQA